MVRAERPLGQQRVPGHHPPGQRQVGQERLRRCQLLPLPRRRHLRQHLPGPVGVRRDQVDPRHVHPMNPA